MVQAVVSKSEVQEGVCIIYSPHTTAGISINENADPSVRRDMLYGLNKLVPLVDNYHHGEGNSAAHIKASLMGLHAMVPLSKGSLLLGTWQGIYFCEFDGPRARTVYIQIMEEK